MKKNIISNKILKNFTHLLFSNVLILILPFIYYPYLIKTIGTENYGNVVYTQSIYFLLSIVIQFGFSISATKQIAIYRENKRRLSTIFYSICLIKLLLFLFVILLSLLILYFLSLRENINIILHLSCIIYLVGDLFFINWFFQGVEKMFYVSLGTLVYKLLLLSSVFLFVSTKDDYIIYTMIFSVCYIIGNFSLFILAIIKFRLTNFVLNKKLIFDLFSDSWQFFLSRLSSVFVERFNILLLGYSSEKEFVAYYDLATKLVGIAQLPFNLFNQAFYPNATREKNIKKVYNVIKLLSLVSILGIILSYVLTPYIIKIYVGDSMIDTAPIINILIFSILINIPSHFIGNCLLVPFGLSRSFKNSVIHCTILYTPILILLHTLNILTIYTLSITYLFYLFIILLYRISIWNTYLNKNEKSIM
ncbi:oligosaccharide flippase family protein [Providencia stuartii]|uniref:oligosaccharide flippase family protein n=1 Tax=Providencia stuartii TaxID=588 RepID=UPI0018756D9B|nr:oligosaccharide flippase family protein [Providencia thailandensis]GHC00122.1 teichoic acid transporter [Providencia thailandensis]